MAEGRRERGGILWLLDLIDTHRGAFEYDFRTRFREPLTIITESMGWGEALRLARILLADPSSAVAAAREGWKYPISREALIAMDLFDLTVMAHSDPKKGRPKQHTGRPFEIDRRDVHRYGKTGGRTREEIVTILNGMGHNLPV